MLFPDANDQPISGELPMPNATATPTPPRAALLHLLGWLAVVAATGLLSAATLVSDWGLADFAALSAGF